MAEDFAISEKRMAQELDCSTRTLQRARKEQVLTQWFKLRGGVRYWRNATIAEIRAHKREA